MRLSPLAVVAILAVLFAVSVGVRLNHDGPTSPYFKGASAMNHRHALAVADGASLNTLDPKAGWPDGYRPAAYRSGGMERFAGRAHRVARYFSEVDARQFSSGLVVVSFCLLVFVMYALVRRLWDCQASGLIAAGVVGLFAPLVDSTDGSQFRHASFAMVLIAVHALLLLSAHRRRHVTRAVIAAVVVWPIMTWWEPGLYYAAVVTALVSFTGADEGGRRRWVVAAHAAVAVAACLFDPRLRELRALASWPVLWMVTTAAAEFAGARLATPLRRLGVSAAAAIVLTVLLVVVRAGAGATVPALEYVWHRLRFLAGKPEAPLLLPAHVRELWSSDHAPPSGHQMLAVFLPLAFLAAATLAGAREHLRRHPVAFATAAIAAAAGVIAYALDRGALVPALVAVAPFVSLGGRGLSRALATRGPLLAVGGWTIIAPLIFPLGAADPVYQIAKVGGFAHRDPARFLWVSSENTEQQLVRFVASRTRVRDPFLGNDNITALLLTFSGRTSVPLPGAVSSADAGRNADLTRLLYQDEDTLYQDCRRLGVAYVLYSIDYLLDTTRYSPAYLAGVSGFSRDSAAFRMHFAPESLRHFTLVYENEHYRLYRVTDERETLFLTDHPPVYQRDAFERVGADRDAFRGRVLDLLLAYRQGMQARERGDVARALELFNWCLEQAPGYTLARIAVGTTLITAGRYEDARDVLMSVISYAPDNPLALYYTAYVHAAMGETDRAREFLDLFFTAATDPDLIARGRLLKTLLDQGVPVTPRSVPQ
jgi:hypothetical protein